MYVISAKTDCVKIALLAIRVQVVVIMTGRKMNVSQMGLVHQPERRNITTEKCDNEKYIYYSIFNGSYSFMHSQ